MSESTPPQRPSIDDQLQAEIEAALGDMTVEDMLDLTESSAPKTMGGRPTRSGTVVAVHRDHVYVEFGPRSQGLCPLIQFETPPKPGDKLDLVVDRFDKAEGLYLLSRPGTISRAEWESLEVGQIVEARCTGVNKGGLEMEVAQHKAFMPAGQVELRHVPDLSVFIGEKFPCEVIEMDRPRGRIILSRRAVLEAQRARDREQLLKDLQIGRQLTATITSVQPYGAFADIGGLDGLIHISDMSHSRLKHPSEVVKIGDKVQVAISKIDAAATPPRIGLSMKQCLADPFQATAAELADGATVTGKVTRVAPFGAFVELMPGVEGLIHISELSHDRVQRVDQVVKPNEVVTVKILSIDPAKHRISLSLKALREKREEETVDRGESPQMRKLRSQLSKKFGPLKGGIG